jgi:hypothetical protein
MTSKELITQLYVGYFNRAPDPAGLAFWITVLENGLSLEAIAQDFATQPESRATYSFLDDIQNGATPSGNDVEVFINAIYQNLFDREPDLEGLTFWSGVLQNGFNPGSFIQAIIEGASPADAEVLANKVEVANFWSDAATAQANFVLDTAYIDASSEVLATVNDDSSVTAASNTATLFFQGAPQVVLSQIVTTVAEDVDLAAPLKVADITVIDDGIGTNVLGLGGADAALFEIVGTELFLKAGSVIDFEQGVALGPDGPVDPLPTVIPTLNVFVTVDDASIGTGAEDSADLSIIITDADEAPGVALTNVLPVISEDADTSAPVKVADVVVTDDTASTKLVSLSGADATLFEIVGTELFLRSGVALDFETDATLDVTVTVDDPSLGTGVDASVTLSLPVGDVNEAPTLAVANATASVAEDLDLITAVKVADILVTDDALGTNDLTLSGDDAALFEISGSELFLRAGAALDFETNATLDVTVDLDDAALGTGAEGSVPISIAVTDVNDPPSLSVSTTVTGLSEDLDTTAPIKVADVTVIDDGQGTNTLVLAGADSALFELVGTELFLRSGVALDFETDPDLDLSLRVDDATVGGTPDAIVSLPIAVLDVNEAANLVLSSVVTALSEEADTSARTKIADIIITDDAIGTNAVSLTGDDAALFEIDGTQLFLRAGTVLDFDTDPVLDVTVTVDDPGVAGTPDASRPVSIAITDTNQVPVVTLDNLVSSLAENLDTTSPVKIADIVVTDDNTGTNVLSLSGADAGLFEITGMELFLQAGTTLDFETQSQLNVSVLVDDASIGTGVEGIAIAAIAVEDVNETPAVSLTSVITTLSEAADTSSRTKVADIVVTDDALGTNTLALTGDDAALFEIDGTELFLRAGTALDFETDALLEVAVTVDDPAVGGTPDMTAPLALPIINVNETPSVTLSGTLADIFESADTSSRIQVATISVTDDGTGTNALSLTGADAALFEIDGTTLFLQAGAALNGTTNGTLDVSVAVDDTDVGGTPDDVASLAITVTPGAPSLVADDAEDLVLTGAPGTTLRIGQVAVADADPDTFGDQPGFALNTDPNGVPYAAIAGSALSLIDTTGHDGLVSLGMISVIDGVGLNADNQGFLFDNTNSAGGVEAYLGAGNVGGVVRTPELTATGEWTFDNTGATGSMQIMVSGLALNAGGLLNFRNADLVIDGPVDLTPLGAGLSLDVNSSVEVGAGGTLTLTVEQADALETAGVTVFGQGTTVITGESGDDGTVTTDGIDTDFGHLRTAVVDLSAVTLSAADTDGVIDIMVSGAASSATGIDLVVGGQRVAQQVIGTGVNDAVTVASAATDSNSTTLDVILQLGADSGSIGAPADTPVGTADQAEVAGDTINLDSTFANVQITADAGFDAVTGAFGVSERITFDVASGAALYAPVVIGDHVAPADSTTAGTAVLEATGTASQILDVSATTNAVGWYLIGSDDNSSSTMTALIGSSQDDWFIDGTAFMNSNAGQTDVFTGGAGDDNFIFNLSNSDPAELAQTVTEIGLDEDTINVATAEALGNDNDDEVISILYELDGVSSTVVVDDPNIDFEDTASIAAGIAAALVAEGVNATATGSDVTVTDEVVGTTTRTGSGFEFQSASQNGNVTAAVATGITETANTANDVARTVEVTIDFTNSANPNQEAVAGEVYSLDITVPGQSTIEIDLLAPAGGEDALDIANAFLADLAFRSQAFVTGAVAGGSTALTATIVFTDNTPDDASGFSVDTAGSASGVISASSASSVLAGALSYTNAGIDVITDFETGADSITFGLDAGSATNYDDGVVETDFDAARMAADAAFAADADLVYFVNSVAGATDPVENGTYLFVNFNGLASGGTADTVVQMTGGVDASSFEAADII